MEELIEIGPWKIYCDAEATRKAYEQIETGYAEICRCDHCLNWIEVRDAAFPKDVLRVFEKIGIDYKKEPEVSWTNREASGRHFYMGWFHFIGRVEGPEEEKRVGKSTEIIKEIVTRNEIDIGNNFSWGFRNELHPIEKIFKDRQSGEINFSTTVPWVIKAKEPM